MKVQETKILLNIITLYIIYIITYCLRTMSAKKCRFYISKNFVLLNFHKAIKKKRKHL